MNKKLAVLMACFLTLSAPCANAQPERQGEESTLIKERAPLETDSAVELKEFNDSGVSVKYPSEWELVDNVQKPRILHVKTLGGQVNASMTLQDLPAGLTLDSYKDATIRDIDSAETQSLQPKKISEEQTHLGDLPAYKLIYSVKIPKTEPPVSAKQTLYLSVKNNRGLLLCCTAFDSLPGKYDAVFRAMADSIKVAEPEKKP